MIAMVIFLQKNIKKMLKPLALVIVFSFLGLYIFYNNGYYDNRVRKEKEEMERMVLKYEEDLKNGVDVSLNDYSVKKADYSNNFTKLTLKISKKIEDGLKYSIKFIFKKINNMVSE